MATRRRTGPGSFGLQIATCRTMPIQGPTQLSARRSTGRSGADRCESGTGSCGWRTHRPEAARSGDALHERADDVRLRRCHVMCTVCKRYQTIVVKEAHATQGFPDSTAAQAIERFSAAWERARARLVSSADMVYQQELGRAKKTLGHQQGCNAPEAAAPFRGCRCPIRGSGSRSPPAGA